MVRGLFRQIRLSMLRRKRKKVREKLRTKQNPSKAKNLFEKLALLDLKIETLRVASIADTLKDIEKTAKHLEDEKEANHETDSESTAGETGDK